MCNEETDMKMNKAMKNEGEGSGVWTPPKSRWEERMESRSLLRKWRDDEEFWKKEEMMADQLADDCGYDIDGERARTRRRRIAAAAAIAAAVAAILLWL